MTRIRAVIALLLCLMVASLTAPDLIRGGHASSQQITAGPSTTVQIPPPDTARAELRFVAETAEQHRTDVRVWVHAEVVAYWQRTHAEMVRVARVRIDRPGDKPSDKTAPTPAAGSIEEMIYAAFGSAGAQAVSVARCESGLNPRAISPGGGNYGLFQINTVHRGWVANMGYTWDQMLEPGPNIAVAYALWSGSGWGPWTCKP